MNAEEVEARYLDVIKKIGKMSGVWPFSTGRQKWILRFIVFLTAVSSASTQIARMVVYFSVDIVMEQTPFLLIALGLLVKESCYIILEDEAKSLLGRIFDDWLVERPKSEMKIMQKYANRGRFISLFYYNSGLTCYAIFTIITLGPPLVNTVISKNEQQNITFPYPAYYGIDEQKYFILITMHMFFVVTAILYVYISVDTIYITIVQHACGLLNIAGYQFQSAIGSDLPYNEEERAKVMAETYRKVSHAAKAHQQAMNYLTQLQEVHDVYLLIVVAFTLAGFSITLVNTSTMKASYEFYKYCICLTIQLMHLLLLSLQGHFVMLANDKVYDTIYEGLWYNGTVESQSLYMLALRRNLTPPMLSAGGLMTLNLESFVDIIKASASYCMVLKSV